MKITKTKLKQLIREEYNASYVKEGSGDRNDPREQGHGPQRRREGSAGNPGEYLEESELLLEAEKSEWVAKIVGYVKKLAAKYGPELIEMIIDSLKDAAMDAMAGDSADIDDGSYGV